MALDDFVEKKFALYGFICNFVTDKLGRLNNKVLF